MPAFNDSDITSIDQLLGQNAASSDNSSGLDKIFSPVSEEPVSTENYANMPWSEVAEKGVRALPSSVGNMLGDIVHAGAHPVETAQNIGMLGLGAASKIPGVGSVANQLFSPETMQQSSNVADAVGEHYAHTYGSIAGLKEALATDPASPLMDLSTVLGGAGIAAKAPGIVGKASSIAGKVGSAIDPLQNTLRLAKMPFSVATKGVEKVAPYIQSGLTGAPVTALKTAAAAGATDNPALKSAFMQHLTGAGSRADILDAVNDAVNQIAKDRSDNYIAAAKQAGLRGADPGTLPSLDWSGINQKLQEAFDMAHQTDPVTGMISKIDPNAAEAYRQIASEIHMRQSAPEGSLFHNLEGFDGLKRFIGNYQGSSVSPVQNAMATKLRQSVVDAISAVHPEYAQIMKNYGNASDQLKDLKAQIGNSNRLATSQQMKKIFNSYKSQSGEDLIQQLGQKDPRIPYMLAGHALSEWLPDRIRQAIDSPAALYALMTHPGALPAFAAASPKLMGNLNYAAGAGSRMMGKLPSISPLQGDIAYQASQINQQPHATGGRIERASGGRAGLDHKSAAEALMRAAERAKKAENETTEPLLNLPDEAITKALSAANEAI